MSECPICSQTFAADKIERHASTCLDDVQLKREALVLSGANSMHWTNSQGFEEKSIDVDDDDEIQPLSDLFELPEERQAKLTGEIMRVSIKGPVEKIGDAAKIHHYRQCEIRFERLLAAGQRYRLHEVELIINPALSKRYHDHKARMQSPKEMWTFHGTRDGPMAAIVREGFRVDRSSVRHNGTMIYSSEDPTFAMSFVRDKRNQLFLCRACPCPRHQVVKSHDQSHVRELLLTSDEQILPLYVLHFESF